MSADNLITWKTETPKPAESMFDILKENSDTETYAFNIAAQAREKERLEAEAAARLDNLSDSELEAQWQRAAAEEQARTLPARQMDAVMRFVQATPELVLNSKTQQRIDAYLKAKKYDATEPAHFDEAYRALNSRNLLDIDESKRQRTPYVRHTEADLEKMSIEELRELAESEGRKR